MTTIAITGVTGALGGEVVRLLAGADMRLDLRLLARDPSRAPDVDTDVRQLDYRDPDPAALRDVDALLFVSASESRDRRGVHRSLVAAAVGLALVATLVFGILPGLLTNVTSFGPLALGR